MRARIGLRLLLIMGLAVVVMACMTACGGSGGSGGSGSDDSGAKAPSNKLTLEQYFNEHAEDLEKIKKDVNANEGYNKILDVDIQVKDNTLFYYYKFKETYPDDQVKTITPGLKESLDTLDKDMSDKIKAMEQGFGVEGITVSMAYLNGDGKEICSKNYEKKAGDQEKSDKNGNTEKKEKEE